MTDMVFARKEFRFLDHAIGGPHRRNNVVPLTELPDATGRYDCFETWNLFSADLATYAAQNPSPKTGRPPSVARYPGPALPRFLPIDLDHSESPQAAIDDARSLLIRLENMGVASEWMEAYFSGNKGNHFHLPAELFGGFEPSIDVHHVCRYIADELLSELSTADRSVYAKLHLFRVPNTGHSSSGLFKVELPRDMLLGADLDQIREYASAPRTPLGGNEAVPVPVLAALREEAERAVAMRAQRTLRDARADTGITALLSKLAHGNRNTNLFLVASALRRHGVSYHDAFALLRAHADTTSFPTAELEQLCRSAYSYGTRPERKVIDVA